MAAIKVVSAYSLQPQVSQLYKQTVEGGKGSGNKSAHFSGLAYGVAQVRSKRVATSWVAGAVWGSRGVAPKHEHSHPISPDLPCSSFCSCTTA